ncbi:adenylate/guanylate cyclase domain-containing protein [Nocardioides sp. ChNu-153]|uniref:adenylate/guanylate cyclase domain-containing protein n=1 Tax=unclassified Nocardioides TaxID=2615069 RepID=UPI002405E9FF|nr:MULTISPECIES: adenylate/guanylate cyclase domain-containing protein [unclassified Nocardioides]MDF9717177.1 hypothetical protein [Nocardioides sp. ChNu-99]MDN7120491.1 adenylate/guanylate cyclase domain-containing protein [Nocardioides sp. ChNu-153]
MPTWSIVLLVVVQVATVALATTFGVLWLTARRRAADLAADLAALHAAEGRPGSRRRLPRPREAVKAVWETVELVRDRGVGGALRSSIEELAGWAQVERPDLVRLATGDGRVTILFSDIEGSTSLNDRLGDRAWVRLLARHDRVVRRAVETHHGQVVKTQGDGFMVAFGPADDAVAAALEVQARLAGWRREPRVRVRMGIHRGSVLHRGNDLFGLHVAYAARVAALAAGGEVLVSAAVADAVTDRSLIDVDGAREVELRGIEGVHVVHRLRTPAPAPGGDEPDEVDGPADPAALEAGQPGGPAPR